MSWLEFISDYKIAFRKGTAHYLDIHCPLCGPNDHSFHLGLSLKTTYYTCWKDSSHRGRKPEWLIKELLSCSLAEAENIAASYFQLTFNQTAPTKEENLAFDPPAEFHEFGSDPMLEQRFLEYIRSRGFDPSYVIPRFKLHWCISGRYAYRIIVPVTVNGRWYSFTGRTISDTEPKRYITASKDNGHNSPTDFLFDEDNLTDGKLLLITEGPFDAMSITSAMIPGVQATALFGQILNPLQKTKLIELTTQYEQIALALDKDAERTSIKIFNQLNWYLPNLINIVPTGKDWNSMSKQEIKKLLSNYA